MGGNETASVVEFLIRYFLCTFFFRLLYEIRLVFERDLPITEFE